jgi:cupin 2 domain-containing protein
MKTGNLLQGIPAELPQEITESLAAGNGVRIERIISKGHCSASDFWYGQEQNEWVLLIKGEARLRFEEGNRILHMTEGTHVNIRAHERHRLEWTREDAETIWLAVFY